MKSTKTKHPLEIPSVSLLESELARVKYRRRFLRVLRSTICVLIVVAAVAVLTATLWLPFLLSMSPTLEDGNIVLSVRTNDLQTGDIVALLQQQDSG